VNGESALQQRFRVCDHQMSAALSSSNILAFQAICLRGIIH
jgi:hypothetical protein